MDLPKSIGIELFRQFLDALSDKGFPFRQKQFTGAFGIWKLLGDEKENRAIKGKFDYIGVSH